MRPLRRSAAIPACASPRPFSRHGRGAGRSGTSALSSLKASASAAAGAKALRRARLPRAFDNLHNGHEGSHHFLVDDFVTAVNTRSLPSVNAWVAARYTLPGIIAHESARQGGVRLEIPDFGDAPQ